MDQNSIKIGDYTIYHNQIITAEKIIHCLENDEYAPCLIAEPQEGKTGVAIYLADWAFKYCKKNDKKAYIFCLCNISDNNLLEQTQDRFRVAKMVGHSFIPEENFQHRTSYSKLNDAIEAAKNDQNAEIYIFVDECHEAINKPDENGDGAVFYKLTQTLGIEYGQPKSSWKSKNVHIVSISATQFAQICNENFNFISLEKTKENPYLGIKHLFDNNRIHQTKPIFDKKNNLSEFIIKVFQDYFRIIEENPGHMVIRLRNPQLIKFKNLMEKFFESELKKHAITFKIYNDKNKNINELDKDLSYFNGKDKTIFLISNAMLAGKTITDSKHLKIWIDNPSKFASTAIQSVGRICGRKNQKEKDDCIYYGVLKHLRNALDFYENPKKFFLKSRYNNNSKNVKNTIETGKKFDKYIIRKESAENKKEPNNTSSFGIHATTIFRMIEENLPNVIQKIENNERVWIHLGGGNNLMNGKKYYYIDSCPECFNQSFEQIIHRQKNYSGLIPTEQQWEDAKNNWIRCHEEIFAKYSATVGSDRLIVSEEFIYDDKNEKKMKEIVMPSMQDNNSNEVISSSVFAFEPIADTVFEPTCESKARIEQILNVKSDSNIINLILKCSKNLKFAIRKISKINLFNFLNREK